MPNKNRAPTGVFIHDGECLLVVERLEAEVQRLMEPLETAVAEDKNATTLFASGLARVETLREEGVVRLVFFETRREMTGAGVEEVHKVTFNVIMPLQAVDPASGLLQRAWRLGRRLRGLAATARQQLLN